MRRRRPGAIRGAGRWQRAASNIGNNAKAAFRQRMAEAATAPQAAPMPMPEDEAAIRATLLAMDPFAFERHVMSFFETAGPEAVVTPRSKDYGMDGYAAHLEGLIAVQCKRYATEHKVGRPALQQFKTVMADGGAWRGYDVVVKRGGFGVFGRRAGDGACGYGGLGF